MAENAKDLSPLQQRRIMVVGETGSGKTSLIRTLPGKKLVYVFDPNSLPSLTGADLEYELWLPDIKELDSTMKGFNKGARDDVPSSKREPRVYIEWGEHIQDQAKEGVLDQYDWLCFDSLTFLAKICMDRQLFINDRYGKVEDLADYRIVGSKLVDLFRSITGLGCNIYVTCHTRDFQDERSRRIMEALTVPGSARDMLPRMFTDTWMAMPPDEEHETYWMRTRAQKRGFQKLRTTMRELEDEVAVPIDWDNPEQSGIGHLLERVAAAARGPGSKAA